MTVRPKAAVQEKRCGAAADAGFNAGEVHDQREGSEADGQDADHHTHNAAAQAERLLRNAGQHHDQVHDGKQCVPGHGDHKEAHGLGGGADLAALEEQQCDGEDGQRAHHCLQANARELGIQDPGQAAEEEAFQAGVRQDQRR